MQRLILRHGDCVEVLRGYEDGCIGAVVSDPPYGLSFMGKEWDDLTAVSRANRGTMPDWKRPEWESSKAPKFQTPAPAFDLSPDSNRRMEVWHLQWFNEAYRVLRPGGVIKAFSGTRTFHRMAAAMAEAGFVDLRVESWNYGSGFPKSMNIGKTLAQYEAAQASDPFWLESNTDVVKGSERFHNWGTALKPSWEPVVVGRKPE